MSAPGRPARAGRPDSAARAVVAALLVAGAGCDGAPEGSGPAVDSTLVDALVEVHLADARAALSDSAGRGGDSLRAVALGAHGLDLDALDRALDRLARDPALAEATYAAVADRLRAERHGRPAPPAGPAP